jgi:hypothetical protein
MTALDVIEQVALVTGKLLHRGSAQPIDGTVRFEAVEGRVYGRVLEDGTFVVTGHPPLLMRGPAPWKLRLRMRVQSGELTTRVVTEELTVNNVTPVAMVDVGTLSFPMTANAIQPNIARTFRGLVVEDKDPHPPVAGAQIEISDSVPSSVNTLTDAQGRFSFDDLVVTGPATIKCTAATFKPQTRQLLIDFHFAMHEVHFRLVK